MAFDDSIPPGSPAASWDPRLQETIRRSYRKRTATNNALRDGLGAGPGQAPPTIPLGDVITRMGGYTDFIRRMFDSAIRVPGLWNFIDIIQYTWDLGFKFVATDRDSLRTYAERRSDFCRDNDAGASMHQSIPRMTFRQVGVCGAPGLHICVVKTGTYPAADGENDLHVDYHQIVSRKLPIDFPFYLGNGNCVYCVGDLPSHWRDVGPWIYEEKVKPALKKAIELKLGPWLAPGAKLLLGDIRAALKDNAYLMPGPVETEKLALALFLTLRDIQNGVLKGLPRCASPMK